MDTKNGNLTDKVNLTDNVDIIDLSIDYGNNGSQLGVGLNVKPDSSVFITAEEIDSSRSSIDLQIEKNLKDFNIRRARKKIKHIRDERRVQLNDPSFSLSKDEIAQIKKDLENDSESNNFRKLERKSLHNQRDNYFEVRQTINDLNDLNEYSAEMEKHKIQSMSDFLKFRDLINLSTSCNSLLLKIKENRKANIDSFIDKLSIDDLDLAFSDKDPLSQLIKLRRFYNIDKSIDDLDLYEAFGLETNIDVSKKLAYIYLDRYKRGDSYSNTINELSQTNLNNPIEQLVKKQIISNKMLGLLLLPASKEQAFISTNRVTCLKTTYTTTETNELVYSTRTLGELLLEITNEDYGLVDKAEKQQIYTSYDSSRPKKEEYYKWNGLQVYDIDLKEWVAQGGNVDLLKQKMHNMLTDFHWYLWICKSASAKGLHIYTKVAPPHHVYINPAENEYISRYWFNVNYATKLANIYDILDRLNQPTSGISFPKEFENKYVDNVVRRITAGIRLTYDSNPLINYNFLDLHPGLGLSQTVDGFSSSQTVERIYFRDTAFNNKFLEFFDAELAVESAEEYAAKKAPKVDMSKYVSVVNDLSSITPLPRPAIKYATRYNVCNTLAAVMGKDGLPLAHMLLDSAGCKNVEEINSFYSCALSNRKEPSKVGLEILRKAGILKHIDPEFNQEVTNTFKGELKQQIEQSLTNSIASIDFTLNDNQYISDIKDELNTEITGEKISIILSPPGSGKTEYIKQLAKDGNKVLLVLPFISVIKNKVETDESISENFDAYYGAKDLDDIESGRNVVTTFDKFSRSKYERLSKIFDYIFIDESHLLFTSGYRIEATSNAVKKLKELFYISSNDRLAAKIVLLTGTETGESYFFSKVAKIIRISKPSLEKHMEFLICDDTLDAQTRMSNSAANLLSKGYKLMIPTNKGEIYTEKIIGMVEYLLQRSVKYGYYKRSNTEQEICRLINNNNTVGDYDIVFCSNYLSVGVDINDKHKFASIYFGDFSGYEIEQFNARIRKTGIQSIYCVATQNADGAINNVLLEEPNLVLKITDEEQVYFLDDKAIAGAKTEFIADYDPILRKIDTPGFSIINGKIQFNLEEYELLSFEKKYAECMQHPIKIARELAKYNYHISVSTEFEGLSLAEQEELKKMGLAAAREEKIRKHSLMVGTYIDLINCNKYTSEFGVEFENTIEWMGKNPDLVVEDRNLVDDENNIKFVLVEYDHFATPVKVTVRSKEAFDKMYKSARYIIKLYSATKAIDLIMQHVGEDGILKMKPFERAIGLLKLISSSNANLLADPLVAMVEKIYAFVDNFEVDKEIKISYDNYRLTLDLWTNQYIDLLGIKINSQYGFEKIQNSIVETLNMVAKRHASKTGLRFSYNKLPEQNSSTVINRRSVDILVQNMFGISNELQTFGSTVTKKHVILENQQF